MKVDLLGLNQLYWLTINYTNISIIINDIKNRALLGHVPGPVHTKFGGNPFASLGEKRGQTNKL